MVDVADGPVSLTREELYQLVWSESMVQLSKRLGMSDVGLSKVCARMKIPTPDRGYWARVTAGQKLRKIPLPKLPPNAPIWLTEMTFGKRASSTTEEAADVEQSEIERFEARPENRIVVSEVLERPHRLVAQTVKTLRGGPVDRQTKKISPKERDKALNVHVTMSSVDRAMRILDALLKACEDRGYEPLIKKTDPSTGYIDQHKSFLRIDGQLVEFRLYERNRKIEKGKDDWGRKEYEYLSSGELILEIHPAWGPGRHKWNDTPQKKQIDSYLNEVLVQAVSVAQQMNERDRENAEREKRRQAEAEEATRKQEAERLRNEKAKRLYGFIRDRKRARQIRAYVEAMRANAPGESRSEASSDP